jgi:hypothetical protein
VLQLCFSRLVTAEKASMTLEARHLFYLGAVLKEYYSEASECRIPMDMFISFLGILTAKNVTWQYYNSKSYVNGDVNVI